MSISALAVLGIGSVDPATPVARADDLGLTRGDGCFEGCRLIDGVVAKLDAHLDRMARSAAELGIAFDRAQWVQLVGDAVTAWGQPDEAALKLVLTRGSGDGAPTGFATVGAVPHAYTRQRAQGLRVVTLSRGVSADSFADAPWLLGGVKTLSYATNMAAQREAERRGADDAILLTSDGTVLEAPTSAVVWARGRTLHTTPTGATGILASTTQALLFGGAASAGWQTEYTLTDVPGLESADAIWLVGSVRGPVEVVDLDGRSRERRPDLDAEIRMLTGF